MYTDSPHSIAQYSDSFRLWATLYEFGVAAVASVVAVGRAVHWLSNAITSIRDTESIFDQDVEYAAGQTTTVAKEHYRHYVFNITIPVNIWTSGLLATLSTILVRTRNRRIDCV